MDENTYRKALKNAAAAKELSSDFDIRISYFKEDYNYAFTLNDRAKRLIILKRLRDELNGYFIKIYQVILSGANLYKKEKKRIKDRSKMMEIFMDDISILDDAIEKLKHPRNFSGHPIAYQLNLEIFKQGEFIKKVLLKVEMKLTELIEVSEEIILREKKEQEKWLENKSKAVNSITKSPNNKNVVNN